MGALIIDQDGNLRVLLITGLLKKSDLDDVQTTVVNQLDPDSHIKLLVIAEGFQGWERGDDWGDLTFFTTSGDLIEKIAIFVPSRWETDLLIFAAAGLRRATVQFFPEGQLARARTWLTT
jgi:hypothetical protein